MRNKASTEKTSKNTIQASARKAPPIGSTQTQAPTPVADITDLELRNFRNKLAAAKLRSEM
jgi:hypothetical protein